MPRLLNIHFKRQILYSRLVQMGVLCRILVSALFSTVEINAEESPCLYRAYWESVQEKGRVGSCDHGPHSEYLAGSTQGAGGWICWCHVLPLHCLLSSSGMEGKIMAAFGFVPVIAMTLPYVPFSTVYVSLHLSPAAAAASVTPQETSRNKPFIWGVCQNENTFRKRKLIC